LRRLAARRHSDANIMRAQSGKIVAPDEDEKDKPEIA
jgi:hypothetical protein